MAKSVKFKNDNYLDSTSIVHNRKKLSEILNDVIYDNTLTGDTNLISIPCNIINDGGIYKVYIIGQVTTTTDIQITINDLTSGYFQSAVGGYISGATSSSDKTGTNVVGWRPNKSNWYYGLQFQTNFISVIKFDLILLEKNYYPYAIGTSSNSKVENPFIYNINMQQSNTVSNITKINIKVGTGYLKTGTRIIVKKI